MKCFRSTDGTDIAYRCGGTGPPLILVHGSATDRSQWQAVWPIFEPHFSIYALDRRGHGLSGDAASYRIESEFDDITALATLIGPGVHVVAHSYGALCALGAGMRAPFRRLVVYEPPLPIRPGDYFGSGLIGTMREALAHGDEAAAVAAFATQALDMNPQQLNVARRLGVWTGHASQARLILRELENVERFMGRPEFFAPCRVPTLLMLGGESPPHYRATAEALRATLSSSRMLVLDRQRHAAISAAPSRFAGEVIAFLTARDPFAQAI